MSDRHWEPPPRGAQHSPVTAFVLGIIGTVLWVVGILLVLSTG